MVGRPYPSPSSRRLTSSREWHRNRDKCMHLSIGLHTSARKSYPQPLQPAKHRGIAPDINQRLYSDQPNYLSTSRSEGRFFTLQGRKYPPTESGKHSPYSPAPQVPQEATYIGRSPAIPLRNNKLSHSTIDTTSTDQKSDQYWSHSPLNRSEAPSTNSRLYPIRIYMTRPALYQAITARGVYRKKGKEARP